METTVMTRLHAFIPSIITCMFNAISTIIATNIALNIIITLLTINVMITTYIMIRWFFAAIGI